MRGEQPPRYPLIWREMDSATEINRILNHPDVFPWIKTPGQQEFDVSALIANPMNVFLRCNGGVVIFMADAEAGTYEDHVCFLKGYRGIQAIKAKLMALDYLFTHTPATFVSAPIPSGNKPCLHYMGSLRRLIGFTPWFTKECGWHTDHGEEDLRYFALPLYDWLRHSRWLERSAIRYRVVLDDELKRHGQLGSNRIDDGPFHDRMFGACIEMCRAGQCAKGVSMFNHWARADRTAQIKLVSQHPTVIETGEALLHITGDSFRALKVKE